MALFMDVVRSARTRKRKNCDASPITSPPDLDDGYMRQRFKYVKDMLSAVPIKGMNGLLRHAISSEDKEPCIQSAMYIMKNIIGFSDRTEIRAMNDMRNGCKTKNEWLQGFYLSLYYSSRAVRIRYPDSPRMVTEQQERHLYDTALYLREKTIEQDLLNYDTRKEMRKTKKTI